VITPSKNVSLTSKAMFLQRFIEISCPPKGQWSPCYISFKWLVRYLDQVQWAFSGTLGKSEGIIYWHFSWHTLL